MGMAKRAWRESKERGWRSSNERVCENCVEDHALKAAIVAASDQNAECTFCCGLGAAPIDVLTEAFVNGLTREYEDADEHVSFDSAEGGYIFLGPHWDTWELIDEYADVLTGDRLIDRMRELIPQQVWVERDFAWRRRDDVLRDAWNEFSEAVKYRTRYVIWLVKDAGEDEMRGWGEVPPGKILYDIADILEELGLIRDLDRGTALWRAQVHAGPTLPEGATAKRLGTAPRECAKQSNRMSPTGIPMFYAAESPETAIAESTRHSCSGDKYVTVGEFRASAPIKVVDFTLLPTHISVFDPKRGHLSRQVTFLNEFVSQLNRPIALGDEPIEYVPTQVMTEFFLRVYEQSEPSRPSIGGIRYPSAVDSGSVSLVLDVDNAHCVCSEATTEGGMYLILRQASTATSHLGHC